MLQLINYVQFELNKLDVPNVMNSMLPDQVNLSETGGPCWNLRRDRLDIEVFGGFGLLDNLLGTIEHF